MKFNFWLLFSVFMLFDCQFALAEVGWVSVESASRNVNVTGFTRSHSKMPLISEVSGKVARIYADVGDPIKEGKKFACLDDTFVVIDIKSAQSEMSRHYVDITYFKKQVARHKNLVKKQTSAVSVLDGLIRDLGKARQEFKRAELRKKRLEELKRRHCIEAPVGWLLTDREIETGQWINEGQVLGHAGNYSELVVPVTLSQHELNALKNEPDKLELVFPDINLKTSATIKHISPAFDEKTRKILVELLIKNIPEGAHGGMRVELSLNIADKQGNSFIISKHALDERFEEYWLERKDGKRIRVNLIKDYAVDKAVISSSEIKLGDQFKSIKR